MRKPKDRIFWGYPVSSDFRGEPVSPGKTFVLAQGAMEAHEKICGHYAQTPYAGPWKVNNLTELKLVKGVSIEKHVEILRRAGETVIGLD